MPGVSQPPLDLRRLVQMPAPEPALQLLKRGRQHENAHSFGEPPAHLAVALYVDVKQHIEAVSLRLAQRFP